MAMGMTKPSDSIRVMLGTEEHSVKDASGVKLAVQRDDAPPPGLDPERYPLRHTDVPVKNTFVQFSPTAADDKGAKETRTWPDVERTPSEQQRAAANAFYSEGRKRYEACHVSEIPWAPCPCDGNCPGHCRPFWRNVFKSEVKKLQMCAQGGGEEAALVEWCPRANCDKCHSKACWPDMDFYRKTMRGKGQRPKYAAA